MMNKKMQVWLPLLLSLVMVAGMFLGYQLQNNTAGISQNRPENRNLMSVEQVMNLVAFRYVDSLNLDSINTGAITAIMNQLDPHSVYIPPANLKDINATLKGNFSGIGVEYQLMNDTVNVVFVIPDGPSQKAGILVGDKLIKVENRLVAGKKISSDTLRNMLRGKSGSTVNVELLRQGGSVKLSITRGSVPLPSLDAAYMAGPEIGYIRLNKFAETTYHEFMEAATDLQGKGMKKMILDLRDNGGGFLDAATNIADELLADGKLIVSTRGNHVKTKEIRSTKPGIFETGDLVLLVNEFSASASEVLAGALQDNDRCTIIGRRSFGKGLVQEQYDLINGGALRLTVARYYTPLGRSIQKAYIKGQKELYEDEVFERSAATKLSLADSVGMKIFTTKKGKKLYNGGGITPDIALPNDSVRTNENYLRFLGSEAVNNETFRIFLREQNNLKKSGPADSLNSKYSLPDWVWPQLVTAAAKDSVRVKSEDSTLRYYALLRTRALMARYIWQSNGYYLVSNASDPTFKTALKVLSGK